MIAKIRTFRDYVRLQFLTEITASNRDLWNAFLCSLAEFRRRFVKHAAFILKITSGLDGRSRERVTMELSPP